MLPTNQSQTYLTPRSLAVPDVPRVATRDTMVGERELQRLCDNSIMVPIAAYIIQHNYSSNKRVILHIVIRTELVIESVKASMV